MSRTKRPASLAATLLVLCLTAPVAANAQRASLRAPDEAATVELAEGGWFRSLTSAAWSWLAALFDEDNGSIVP